MAWSKVFKSQCYDQPTYKHKKLPIFYTKEFDFYRCVEFNESLYELTAWDLFHGNLRMCSGRYSSLFPGQKVSYWADSPMTARAEIKSHGAGCNIMTFHAYDDSSSFIPCLGNDEMLYVVDGRKCGIQCLIEKADNNIPLTKQEKQMMKDILNQPIDCIAYDSKARPGGENFIFLERGFNKLALREISLRFGRKSGGNHNSIVCSVSSDYTPHPKAYGDYFLPKCKVKRKEDFLTSKEYLQMEENMKKVLDRKFNRKSKNKNG